MTSRLNKAKQGFALLITITLLAFLVILLIGLATFTRVETAIAGNTQRQAQARENALFALNVALGQLQRHAGPDKRVTATAESFGGVNGTRSYTGVWASDLTDDSDGDPLTPNIWLVSGNELVAADGTPNALAIRPDSTLNTTNGVPLVSTNTSRVTNDVLARLMPITATGVPGTAATASTTIGRYAWWVGDQGVKAPVAVADSSNSVSYAPYDSADLRSRIRQQIALGAGAADSGGNPVFEPRDSNNSVKDASGKTLVEKATAISQVAFLKNTSNAQLGLTYVQQNFHNWSPNNYAVIANTKTGGLKRDLSLNPSLLGSAFAAWADYTSYTENPVNNVTESGVTSIPLSIVPAYSSDPIRRRVTMQAAVSDQGLRHSIAPVLAQCALSFNIRTRNGNDGPIEVRVRWYVSLWNPYTTALVPEKNMRLEIEGLPDRIFYDVVMTPTSGGPPIEVRVPIRLYDLFQDSAHTDWKFPLDLAWDDSKVSGQPDMQSWLPGRVYTWISTEHSLTPTPDGGLASAFYETNFSAVAGKGDTRDTQSIPFQADDNGTTKVGSHVVIPDSVNLVAKLYRTTTDTVPMATFNAPTFLPVLGTDDQKPGAANYQFGFVFRLFESGHVDVGDKGAWLTDPSAIDPRSASLPQTSFRLDAKRGDDPAQYQTALDLNDPKYLLDRTQSGSGSQTYNEDVPLFELPRGPLLSLGALQHLQADNGRPFSIGNSWGAQLQVAGASASGLFDSFFFSGLTNAIAPTTNTAGDVILPNPQLKLIRKADGLKVTADDLRNVGATPSSTDADGNTVPGTPSTSQSSKFLLQGGAFNLNSTNATAWAAVLRGVRFPAPQSFTFLDADPATGTAGDDTDSVQSSDAEFFRFSQTAQETYKAGGDDTIIANTHLFRRGMRTLAPGEVAQLATNIAAAIKARLAVSGPFRSLEEFLAPGDGGAPSLLEQAIADAGINASIAEFSSQWLTQADILTALAPVLFPRSDTFVIRAYGEVLNPATSTPAAPAIEGRAWCEAVVQRLPEYFDSSNAAEIAPTDPAITDLNKTYGRRFKIVSFRWLTRSDI